MLALDAEERVEQRLQREPLVQSHAVDDEERGALATLKRGEDVLGEHVGRQLGSAAGSNPVPVVFDDETRELVVGGALLIFVRFGEPGATITVELDVPADHSQVRIHPAVVIQRVERRRIDVAELRYVIACNLSLGQLVALQDAAHRGQDLRRLHRLQQVVVGTPPDRLIHDVFLFALGHHDDRNVAVDLPDLLQRLQAILAGHHLVEKHHVEGTVPNHSDGVIAVGNRRDRVAPLLEKREVGPEHLDLVVDPENRVSIRHDVSPRTRWLTTSSS
jgi:hypothetical protein